MKQGIIIDTMIQLYAYCADFDLDSTVLLGEIRDKYDERTRHGCYPIPYDKWVNDKLNLLRIDKGHGV